MSNNMELWNAVCKTDPKHTKKVTLGRTFTAIDPMYQVQTATQHLGMVGEGWGFTVKQHVILPTDEIAVLVRVWCKSRKNYIEQWGQNGLYTDKAKTKTDTDCMKKATTDGITKCLSFFGFNADVFLGKFDDNKYVQQMEREFAAEKKEELTAEQKKVAAVKYVDGLKTKYRACKDLNALMETQKAETKNLTRISEGYPELFAELNKVAAEVVGGFDG